MWGPQARPTVLNKSKPRQASILSSCWQSHSPAPDGEGRRAPTSHTTELGSPVALSDAQHAHWAPGMGAGPQALDQSRRATTGAQGYKAVECQK